MKMITITKKSFYEGCIYIGKDFISNGEWAIKNERIKNIDIFKDPRYAAAHFGVSVSYKHITFEQLLRLYKKDNSEEQECWEVSKFIIGYERKLQWRIYIGIKTDKMLTIPEVYYQWLLPEQLFSPIPDKDETPRIVYNDDKTIALATMPVDYLLKYNEMEIMETLLNWSIMAKPEIKEV